MVSGSIFLMSKQFCVSSECVRSSTFCWHHTRILLFTSGHCTNMTDCIDVLCGLCK